MRLFCASLATFCFVALQPACNSSSPGVKSGAGGKALVASVLTTPLQKARLPIVRDGVGHAAPFYGVTVRPQVDGRVQAICFQEGDVVKQNQVLGIIDPRPYKIAIETAQAALKRDRATLDNAQLNLTRYRRLRHDKMVSEQQLTDQQALVSTSEATVLSDEAQLAQAELQLDYAYVKAPIEGTTGFRGIDPGSFVRASDSNGLVTINQTDPIAILFTLPQDALPDVFAAKDANRAIVRVFARDGETALGEGPLSLIDNQVQAQTGTIRLKAVLPNPHHALWPNQFLRVSIELGQLEEQYVVPAVSLRADGDAQVVFVAQGDKARRVPVTVLGQSMGRVAVKGALHDNEMIVTEGAARLTDGAAIAVQQADTRKEASPP